MGDVGIPKMHKAVIFIKPGTTATKVVEVETPEPKEGEVLIRLTHSGVCHSDFGFIANVWDHMPEPTPEGQIGGHEGVGEVVKLGPGVVARKIGDRVGVKWITSSCLTCGECLDGNEGRCASRKVSGYRTPGTFQQYITSDASYVTPIPDEVGSAEAAPLLCGGVTVYVALKKCDARPGDWVALSGAGGGLGHLAIQYAKSMGFRVVGIDHGSKKDFCLGLGADEFVDFTKFDTEGLAAEIKRITKGGAHSVLVNNASTMAYDQALDFLRYGGTLVCVGVPEGQANPIKKALPHVLITNKFTIRGTVVGNRKDAVDCMQPAAHGQVKAQVRLEPMSKLTQVFDEMAKGMIHGRVVLDLWKVD